MKLSLDRDPFLTAIQRVIGAVDRKGSVVALQHVLIEAGETVARITATNRDMQARTECACTGSAEAVTFTLPGQTILDALNNLPAGAEVVLSSDESDPRIQVSAARSRFKMPQVRPTEIPIMAAPEGSAVMIGADVLASLLDGAAYAVHKDQAQYIMTGVYLNAEDGKLVCVGTDSKRIGYVEAQGVGATGSAVIPASLATEMLRLASASGTELASLVLTDAQAQLRVGATALTGKVLDGEYVAYPRIMGLPRPHRAIVDRDMMLAALRRALIMAPDATRSIHMTIGGDFIGFVARNTSSGEAENEVEADVDGAEVTISLNGGYLSDALTRLDCDAVTMTYADRLTPIKLEGGGREAFIAGQRG